MRPVPSEHPPGTIVVPTTGSTRYQEFYQSLERVQAPQGSGIVYSKTADLAAGLNRALDEARGEWVWFMGDDHEFSPDTLLRLLDHRLPAVVALNVQRVPPFGPVILRGQLGGEIVMIGWGDVPVGRGLWVLPHDLHAGTAGLLVRRSLLQQVPRPVFRVGQYDPERLNEDIWLHQCLREQGVPTVVDLNTALGHTNAFTVTPVLQDDGWWLTFSQDRKLAFASKP